MRTQRVVTNHDLSPNAGPAGSSRNAASGRITIWPSALRPASGRLSTALVAAMLIPLALAGSVEAVTVLRIAPTSSSVSVSEGATVTFRARFYDLPILFHWDQAEWYVGAAKVSSPSMSGTDYTTSYTRTFSTAGTYYVQVRAKGEYGPAYIWSPFLGWTVTVTGPHKVTISSVVGGTSTPAPGTYTYAHGYRLSIVAKPETPEYSFERWDFSGSLAIANRSDASTTVTVNGNGTLTPVFTHDKQVTICTPTGGTVSPSPGTRYYTAGTSLSIRATPNSGCTFKQWDYTGGVSIANRYASSTTMTVNNNGSLCPVFSCGNNTVTICSPTGGTVSPSPGTYTYTPPATVTIRATPNTGCTFVQWTVSGGVSVANSTAATTTMRVTSSGTLCPVFSCTAYSVTIYSSTGGTVSPSPGTYNYTAPTSVTATATPNPGYSFEQWVTTGGITVANPYATTTTMTISGTGTLRAQFRGVTYCTIIINEPKAGMVSPRPGSYTSPVGTRETISASPDPGYRFVRWVGTGGARVLDPTAAETELEFMGNGDLTAVFEADQELAHWPLDETAGRIAHDIGVSACDGMLAGGPVWQPTGGKVGGALRFDGVDDCIFTDIVLDPVDGPFSAFAWVKGGAAGEVILSQDGAAGGTDWLAASSTGRLMTNLGGQNLTSSIFIIDGQWHEVGLVWDGSTRMLYVDAVLAATDTRTGPSSSPGGMNIGVGRNLDSSTYWSGWIDDVRIDNGVVVPKCPTCP